MDKKRWETEYPKMPESFHQAVAEMVDTCTRKTTETKKQTHRSWSSRHCILLAAAVSIMLLMGSLLVGAGEKFDFRKTIGLGDSWVPEEIFQKEAAVQGTASELLEIREICFDGMRLMIHAVPTERGKAYEMETLRMEIDGEEICPVSTQEYGKSEKALVFTADLSEKEIAAPFQVRQEVRVYGGEKRYEKQEMCYTVNAQAKVEVLPDAEWEFEDFTVRVSHMKKSPVVVQGLVEIEMTQEQRERYEAEGEDIMALVSAFGKNGEPLTKLGLFEGESVSVSHHLDSFQVWFSCLLSSAQEESITLRLQKILPKADDDDWEAIARQQFEDLRPFYGEAMEIVLTSS